MGNTMLSLIAGRGLHGLIYAGKHTDGISSLPVQVDEILRGVVAYIGNVRPLTPLDFKNALKAVCGRLGIFDAMVVGDKSPTEKWRNPERFHLALLHNLMPVGDQI